VAPRPFSNRVSAAAAKEFDKEVKVLVREAVEM